MSDVLIICEKINNFANQSVTQALREAGLNVESYAVKDEISQEILLGTKLVLILGSNIYVSHNFTLQNFNKKCEDVEKPIVVYGLEEENDILRELLSKKILVKELIRPMAPEELAEEMKRLVKAAARLVERKTIMVVDDSGMVLRSIQGWLEEKYEVMLANSAIKALSLVEEKKPDLIFLDYEMPEMDGPECFELLRARDNTRDIPVIFLTSKGDPESVKAVLSRRPAGYILKPSSKENLIERIEEVLMNC